MRKVRYDYWADYIYSISHNQLGSKPHVLELAAGNCQLAKFLSAYYPKYIATDLSLAMLNYEKSSKIKRICCDMRSVPLLNNFDLIVSAFDSINYLMTRKDLKMLFGEIRRLLADRGLFTFDVSLVQNSYRHIKDPLRKGTYKGIRYRQETSYDTIKKIHSNNFYIEYPNGEIVRETHVQKVHNFDTYFDLIELSGLVVSECFEAFTFKDGTENSPRVQFIVMKK